MIKKTVLLFISLFSCTSAFSQSALDGTETSYLWPTDASHYLTSSFCEYRPRRYHAGIDIKTWGKTGYKAVAVRPGYVWRVSVSPFGYGKALYLKLDTGEVAVYAHLSKFNDEIERRIKAEQKQLGRYRVNMFFEKDEIPVARGEVVARTGRTGIGAPHLHFEIRDAENRPINPLSKGYDIRDPVSPVIRKISFTPLDAQSEINGDYAPVVLTPQWAGPNEYAVKEPVAVWGRVGVAVSAYDKSSNAMNRYGPYSLKLYVDGELHFEYRYDRMSFQENRMVELEREYRLARRNYGRLYKLYKDEFNKRSIYNPNKPWAGVLQSAPLNTEPDLWSRQKLSENRENSAADKELLWPGSHELRIEVGDYAGNISTLHCSFKVGSYFDIRPLLSMNEQEAVLHDVITYDLRIIENLQAARLWGSSWRDIPLEWIPKDDADKEKGGEGDVFPMSESQPIVLPSNDVKSSPVLKFQAQDQFGLPSYPYFHLNTDLSQHPKPPEVETHFDFYDDYVRLEIESRHILPEPPVVTLYPFSGNSTGVEIHQKDLREYVGRIRFADLEGKTHLLRLAMKRSDGDVFTTYREFQGELVKPFHKASIESSDQKCRISFWAKSLYRPLFVSAERDTSVSTDGYEALTPVYRVTPDDALMQQGAMVHLVYPDSTLRPEQLGVYYRAGRRWAFIDNRLDQSTETVSARVLSFEQFAVLRDADPPEITGLWPARNAVVSQTPLIAVNVRDRQSGIGSEKEIEILLDGELLIAEYDPEQDRLTYQVEEPLTPGTHDLSVRARDRSGNIATKEAVFRVP